MMLTGANVYFIFNLILSLVVVKICIRAGIWLCKEGVFREGVKKVLWL